MDSSPVDEAWDAVEAEVLASNPPPSGDERPPVQVIAELRHPHLVLMQRAADGVGFEPDLAGGMSLAELCRTDAGWFPLPLRVGLRILLDALSGLAAIHQATQGGNPIGFVHGELAPPNIIIGRDGVGRLIPALPAHWSEAATPSPEVTGYIAPERLLGDTFGQPADVFSAGVLLWEAVTGKPLFRNWPLDAIVTQLIGRKVAYPIPFGDALWGVPLADVAMRALSVDPAERWNHVGALGAQIETIARGHLAAPDEIAALVAGFSAGKGRASLTTLSDATTNPPPAPPAVTSLSPTASSIQSPAVAESPEGVPVIPVGVPIQQGLIVPPPQSEARWTAPATVASTRIWLPTDDSHQPGSVRPASSDVADSWSGIAPSPAARKPQTVAWAAAALGLAIAGGTIAYHFLERGAETRAASTVLAPKMASPSGTTAPALTVVAPAKTPATEASSAGDNSAAHGSPAKANEAPSAAPLAVPAPPPAAPSAPAPVINRPRPPTRPIPAPPTAPSGATQPNVAPPPAPAATPAAPPAAPKPKPKEDLFGI